MSSEVNVRTTESSLGSTLLFIAFLVLKLTKVISWSWWWVTAPLWGPAVLALLIIAVAFVVVSVKR